MTTKRDSMMGLIGEIFRLHGRLSVSADTVLAERHLTSARWQVLAAISGAQPDSLPVSHLARNLGLTRQAVQRQVDAMRDDALIRFLPNPHHSVASLVVLTPHGEKVYKTAMKLMGGWADGLAQALNNKEIETATTMLKAVQERLVAAQRR
jgi:DNA-binding MarR family transcriptional regulator